MTAPDLSPAEAARVAEFDAAPEPPESSPVVVAMLALADELDHQGRRSEAEGETTRNRFLRGRAVGKRLAAYRLRATVTAALNGDGA